MLVCLFIIYHQLHRCTSLLLFNYYYHYHNYLVIIWLLSNSHISSLSFFRFLIHLFRRIQYKQQQTNQHNALHQNTLLSTPNTVDGILCLPTQPSEFEWLIYLLFTSFPHHIESHICFPSSNQSVALLSFPNHLYDMRSHKQLAFALFIHLIIMSNPIPSQHSLLFPSPIHPSTIPSQHHYL
jgi:hypothetical protein